MHALPEADPADGPGRRHADGRLLVAVLLGPLALVVAGLLALSVAPGYGVLLFAVGSLLLLALLVGLYGRGRPNASGSSESLRFSG